MLRFDKIPTFFFYNNWIAGGAGFQLKHVQWLQSFLLHFETRLLKSIYLFIYSWFAEIMPNEFCWKKSHWLLIRSTTNKKAYETPQTAYNCRTKYDNSYKLSNRQVICRLCIVETNTRCKSLCYAGLQDSRTQSVYWYVLISRYSPRLIFRKYINEHTSRDFGSAAENIVCCLIRYSRQSAF